MNKKQQEEMIEWIGDRFCDIMEICDLAGYKLTTTYEPDENRKDGLLRTFAVQLTYPYRHVYLTIGKLGAEAYQEKQLDFIKQILAHEAFHIWHWKYKKLAKSRYIHSKQIDDEEEDLADRFSIIISNLIK